jgi:putative MFS transporter
MSLAMSEAMLDRRAPPAVSVAARMDRLPSSRTIWRLVLLLSIGGFFEYYELFSSAYLAPGLVHAGILTPSTQNFFGMTGVAGFVGALFLGLWMGTILFGFVADRFGRRAIFTWSLLWYSAASAISALQTDAASLEVWRFITGLGLGVELVTIDAYLSELVSKHSRGRAFAFNQSVQFAGVPVVAFVSWLLVPSAPFGVEGWRWVLLVGAAGALPAWWIRRHIPESPRWLAGRGRLAEAETVVAQLETSIVQRDGMVLPEPIPQPPASAKSGRVAEIWSRFYAPRTIMLIVFNLFQTVGIYGFSSWVPTLLMSKGIALSDSLGYTLCIALANPIGPLLGLTVADRAERKWQIVVSGLAVAGGGLVFAGLQDGLAIILVGVLIKFASTIFSSAFKTFQAELYPTRIRGVAVGFVYSFSRLSGVFSGFLVAFTLREWGVQGVFVLLAACMSIVCLLVAALGPRTRGRALETISP